MKDFQTRAELVAWARRTLVEAMLAGISMKVISKGIGIPAITLESFACHGKWLEDQDLKMILIYFGHTNPEASKMDSKRRSYFGAIE